MADWASEAGHFYWPDGRTCYEVPNASGGGMRPTTLKDARKMGLFYSVSGVLQAAAKPGLEKWKRNNVMLSALTNTRRADELEIDWLKRIEADAEEEARRARERGTEIHGVLEAAFRGEPFREEFRPWFTEAVMTITDVIDCQQWSTEKSFAHPLGFGGKIDLQSDGIIIDYKGKDSLDELKLWDEHFMQLGAYRYGSGKPGARCFILFFDRNAPQCVLMEAKGQDLRRGWEMFKALLLYVKNRNNYFPSGQ